MAIDYTATGLVSSVRRRGMLAATAEALDTPDYLALMDEELRSYILPLVMSAREEYFVTQSDITIVSGTDTYAIPSRAVGQKLRMVAIQTTTGAANTFRPLYRTEPEHEYDYTTQGGTVSAYDLRGNSIILVPGPNNGGLLRIKWFLRPNQLVSSSTCAQIVQINTGNNTAVFSGTTVPAGFTVNSTYDIIKGTPGFDNEFFDQAVVAVGSSPASLQFSSTIPSTVSVGDWVALAGQSPIPQCPYELHPLLAQRTVIRALAAVGDPRVQIAEAEAKDLERRLMTTFNARTEGSARVIINYNGPGFAKVGRFRRR